jgi:glycosyltransferase involved in cell wall biosynthesis
MASRADLVLIASAELLRRRGSSNPRTHIVPHGARSAHGLDPPVPREVAGLPRPRVGFVGSISEWIDIDLLERLARARPEWSFVMVGPVKTRVDRLRKRANVVFTGERPYEEIPGFLSSFDSAIIPYRVTPAIEAASSLKLREYLTHGLPVVSVDIPDARSFSPRVRIATGPKEFLACLEEALVEGRSEILREGVVWSWDDCAAEASRRIDDVLHAP